MLEIKNVNKFPVQVIVKSRNGPREFTVKNIPGRGRGNNVFCIQDERSTEYIDRLRDAGLIQVRSFAGNGN